jgi:uncharacterized membrane protein YkoI
MKSFIAAVALVASVSTAAFAATPMPLKGSQYLPQTKVTLAQARATALKAERGTIVAQELEMEQGRLRYSFDVKVGKVMREVGVDAKNGKVLEDSVDNGND